MSNKSFFVGLMLGAIGGALLVVNSRKAQMLVKKSQEDLKCKVSEFVDEKIEEMQETEHQNQTNTKKPSQANANASKAKKD